MKKTFEGMDMKKILENGFKRCGLQPFDVEAIDFSKTFDQIQASLDSSADNSSCERSDSQSTENSALKILESVFTTDQLQAFRLNTCPVWQGVRADQSLFELWYKFFLSQTWNGPFSLHVT